MSRDYTVDVRVVEEYPYECQNISLVEFMSWLQIILGKIPDEYRAAAEIYIGSTTDHDISLLEFTVSYSRPMTPEEKEDIVAHDKRVAEHAEWEERKLYEGLKRKYELKGESNV